MNNALRKLNGLPDQAPSGAADSLLSKVQNPNDPKLDPNKKKRSPFLDYSRNSKPVPSLDLSLASQQLGKIK